MSMMISAVRVEIERHRLGFGLDGGAHARLPARNPCGKSSKFEAKRPNCC